MKDSALSIAYSAKQSEISKILLEKKKIHKTLQAYVIKSECAALIAQTTISNLEGNSEMLGRVVSDYADVASKIVDVESDIENAKTCQRYDKVDQLLEHMTELESECVRLVTDYLHAAKQVGDAAIELKLITEIASKEVEAGGGFIRD